MDAIPSLCASTASCGAAAVGLAYGQNIDSARRYDTERTHGGTVNPPTPLATPTSYPTPRQGVARSSTAQRPQSAALPRVSSWAVFRRTSLDEREGSASSTTQQSNLGVGETNSTPSEESEERPGVRPRSSWIRRVSNIAQSQECSSPSTPRPSTPSLFSNGSSAPLFGTNRSNTTRNRLVKRSTSQKALHPGSYSGSPFPPSQTSTFRRPATSHQRSEQLNKLHTLQQVFESPHRPQENLSEEPSAAISTTTTTIIKPSSLKPYFELRSLCITSDTTRTRRSTSIPRIRSLTTNSRPTDTVRCVEQPMGRAPLLVKPGEVEKYPSIGNQRFPPQASFSSPLSLGLKEQPSPIATQHNTPAVRPRTSYSISDIMSTPSPPWKLRGGSLRRKKGRAPVDADRRIVSAPQKIMLGTKVSEVQQQDDTVDVYHGHSASTEDELALRGPSSPLPPVHRLSAFEIELPSQVSTGPSSPVIGGSDSPIMHSGVEGQSITADSSFRSKNFRTSRIPSDRESTVFSSDNEHGRVFSTDGDDAGYRSETVFDSIRTDATSHSHAGGKGYHIENVFGDAVVHDLGTHNMPAFPGRLERNSMTLGNDDIIDEESESVATPVQNRQAGRDQTVSPQRPTVPSLHLPASPHRLPTPTRRVETYPQNIDFDDEWSGDDGDDESEHFHDARSTTNRPLRAGPGFSRHSDSLDLPERPRSNVFDWSEPHVLVTEQAAGSSPRPMTAQAKTAQDRGSRSTSRRGTTSMHLRSQSVPLPPDNSNHRFNNASKLDAWILGGKGVSEDWDNDFEFDEALEADHNGDARSGGTFRSLETSGVLVPPSIIEKQASVHGQFGQVKELTLLVEELRRLRHSATAYGILHGQASGLWKEAEGIIDLATLDDDEDDFFAPQSPASASFDFDAFDDDSASNRRRRSSASPQVDAVNEASTPSRPSPAGSRLDAISGRPRKESIAKAKNVLENIHQHRKSLEPVPDEQVSPKKLPFDTTSLRDLVTRAGVVTRALKEIVRRFENPDSTPQTPERHCAATPPDPPFSHIFQQPPSPSSSRKSPRVAKRKSSSSFLNNSVSANDTNDFNGHMKIMTVA